MGEAVEGRTEREGPSYEVGPDEVGYGRDPLVDGADVEGRACWDEDVGEEVKMGLAEMGIGCELWIVIAGDGDARCREDRRVVSRELPALERRPTTHLPIPPIRRPSTSSMIPPAPWTAALNQGLARLRAGEFDDALTALDEVSPTSPLPPLHPPLSSLLSCFSCPLYYHTKLFTSSCSSGCPTWRVPARVLCVSRGGARPALGPRRRVQPGRRAGGGPPDARPGQSREYTSAYEKNTGVRLLTLFSVASLLFVRGQDEARLLARPAALPERVQSLILSPASANSPSDRVLEDRILRAHGEASHLRRARNLIDYLPDEMLVEIGQYVVLSAEEPSSELALDLIGVCKRWRAVFAQDKQLWGRLHLKCYQTETDLVRPCSPGRQAIRRGTEKAIALLPKGVTRVVWIEGDSLGDWHAALALLGGTLSGVREIDVTLPPRLELDNIWTLFRSSTPLLRTLSISYDGATRLRFRPLPLPPAQPSLTSLSLATFHCVHATSIFSLLRRFPSLEHLKIGPSYNLVFSAPASESNGRLLLSNLRTIRLDNLTSTVDPSARFSLVAPRLESLTVSSTSRQEHGCLLFPSDAPPNTACLQTLVLHHAGNATVTAAQLRQMPELRCLKIASTRQPGDTTLSSLIAREGEEVTCPLLERLEVSCDAELGNWFSTVQAGVAAMEMVRSRTGGAARMSRLRELTMDDGKMDRGTYDWLKANVDQFENARVVVASSSTAI